MGKTPLINPTKSDDPSWSAVLCAVVVTYNPADDVINNLQAMVRECGRTLVVDNGSSEEMRERMATVTGVELLALGTNHGVATALNRGFAWAVANRFEWVLTFDQDSRPLPGFVPAIWATHKNVPQAPVVGAHITEKALGGATRWLRPHAFLPCCFQRVSCVNDDLADVTMVVTSGALTSVATWQCLGGFDERLFIDFVDTDFCLRVRAAGGALVVCAGALLLHQLGRRERQTFLGMSFHPTHHPALRHYYIARNRWPMLLRHAWRYPHWAVYELMATALWLFRTAAFEHQRVSKLKAMCLGTWDGLLGRSGPCRENRRRTLQQ